MSVKASTAYDAETEASRKALEGFIALLGKGDVEGAAEQYTTESYTQHMPGVPPGRAGSIAYIKDELARGGRVSILSVVAERNMVALHMTQTFSDGSPDREVIEMWRVENGRLAEHWGAGQNISKK